MIYANMDPDDRADVVANYQTRGWRTGLDTMLFAAGAYRGAPTRQARRRFAAQVTTELVRLCRQP